MAKGKRSFQAKVGGKSVLEVKHSGKSQKERLDAIAARDARSQRRHDTIKHIATERETTKRKRSEERSKGTKYRSAGVAAGAVGNNAIDSAYSLTKGGVNEDQKDSGSDGSMEVSFGGGRIRA